jgi:hypothetical protein
MTTAEPEQLLQRSRRSRTTHFRRNDRFVINSKGVEAIFRIGGGAMPNKPLI